MILKNGDFFDLRVNQRHVWVDEIKEIIGEDSNQNVIQFCLSYTLQSLRNDKDRVLNEFKWNF